MVKIPNMWRGVWPMSDGGIPVVTQSMVTSFVSCPREVYYSSVLGLRPRLSTIPLTRGTWVHALLEAKANGLDWRAKHEEISSRYAAETFSEESDSLAEECYNIVTSYEWKYRDDPLETIAAELTVERPMLDGQVLYRGRIDLIARDKHGDIWLVDHKTHRSFPDWRYRELAFQHYSYLWACGGASQYLDLGLPQPKGFIYDYCKTGTIRTPTILKSTKISRAFKPEYCPYPVLREWLLRHGYLTEVGGETLIAVEDPEERSYIRDIMYESKIQKDSSLFRRDYMQFTPAQAQRQLRSFMRSTYRMMCYRWDNPDFIERNLHACSGYTCSYRDLTTADLVHGTSHIEQETRYVKTSDPLDYYPEQNKRTQEKGHEA